MKSDIRIINIAKLNKMVDDMYKYHEEKEGSISEEQYLLWMNDFFHDADKEDPENYSEWISYLMEAKDENKLSSVWNSMLEGRLGMKVRNYMREKHPEIDEDTRFKNDDGEFDYGMIEDYSLILINKLLEKIEKGEIN